METQTKTPLVATPDEVSPGIENVETLDEWQNLIDGNWDLSAQKAKKKLPMYVSYYGYSMRYWPHSGETDLQVTPAVADRLDAPHLLETPDNFVALDEEVANKLGIPYADLMRELAA